MAKLLIFVPCYNCEKQISRVIDQLEAADKDIADEVVFVDNQSRDGTREAIKEGLGRLKIPAKLLVNNQNYGLGGSHKVAFNYAVQHGFEHVLILHGDDQGDLSDFAQALRSKEYLNWDLFLGARFHELSKLRGYSATRTLGNRVFNLLSSLLYRKRIKDLGGSGLNIFSLSFIQRLPVSYMEYSDSLVFHIYLLLNAVKAGGRLKFAPITWREDDQVSNVRLIPQAMEALKVIFSVKLSKQGRGDKKAIGKDYSFKVASSNVA